MEDKNFSMARRIAEKVAEAGGRSYFVGGMVRDRLSGRESKDVDIEIHGITPEALREILQSLGNVTSMGASFGILGLQHYDIDIAMPRKEHATGRGHKDFEVFVDPFLGPEKAALRRDFTMNAMMEDVLTGEVLDFFGGQEDMKKGILRHVNDRTFAEDPLRVLRAAQFAARFGYQVADETVALARTMDLTVLARERIYGELEKAFNKAEKPSIFFEQLRRMDQLHDWFPELEALQGVPQDPVNHPEGDVWIHTMMVLDAAAAILQGGGGAAEQKAGPGGDNAVEQEPVPDADSGVVQQAMPGVDSGEAQVANRPYFLMAALVHDLGKAITTTVGKDGRIHAYQHETKGLPLVKAFVRRLSTETHLLRYALNMTELHMRPNMCYRDHSSNKATMHLFDESICPEELVLLAKADWMGRKDPDACDEAQQFLWERLAQYRDIMARPTVQGRDLVEAGIAPGPHFKKALEYAHKLHLAGVEKESALAQTLAFLRGQGDGSPALF